jgi:hypothetical protein
MFHYRAKADCAFVILTACLDESGTHDGSPATVAGALMGNVKQWDRFETGFSKLRNKHHFDVFHTKKFKKKTGDFTGGADQQCVALMDDLMVLTDKANFWVVTPREAPTGDFSSRETSGSRSLRFCHAIRRHVAAANRPMRRTALGSVG